MKKFDKLFDIRRDADTQGSRSYGFTINTGATYSWRFFEWDCRVCGSINIGKRGWEYAFFLTDLRKPEEDPSVSSSIGIISSATQLFKISLEQLKAELDADSPARGFSSRQDAALAAYHKKLKEIEDENT